MLLGSGIPIKTFIYHWHTAKRDNPLRCAKFLPVDFLLLTRCRVFSEKFREVQAVGELEKLPTDCRPWGPSLELEIYFEIAPPKNVFFFPF